MTSSAPGVAPAPAPLPTGLDLFPVTWSVGDAGADDDAYCRITTFGKLADGRAACLHIRFTPYFFVELPLDWSAARGKLYLAECARKHGCASSSQLVSRKSLWGFSGGRSRLYAQLAFRSLEASKKARRWLTYAKPPLPTFEAGVEPVIRLFHLRGIGPSRWLRAEGCAAPSEPAACVDVEVECNFTGVRPSVLTCRPPLVFASWDIEARSASGGFPVSDRPDDYLIQIATAFRRYGEAEPFHRAVTCLRPTADVEGVEIEWSEQEGEVIEAWTRLLRRHKTDVLLGYNTHQFDWRYVSGRAGVLVDDDTGEGLVDLSGLGRAAAGGGAVREFELNSGAYGQNKFFVLQTPGVQQIDLLQYVRREYKLDSYSLDNVSKKYLGSSKLDMPASQIFSKFLGSPEDRAEVARYAVRDTELPLGLMTKLSVWENLAEMANAVNVPVEYLLARGQQVIYTSIRLQNQSSNNSFRWSGDSTASQRGSYWSRSSVRWSSSSRGDVGSYPNSKSLYLTSMSLNASSVERPGSDMKSDR